MSVANELSIISEECDEDLTEDSDNFQKLLEKLKTAQEKANNSQKVEMKLQKAESRIQELNRLYNSKCDEVQSLKRKVSHLQKMLEEKDEQLFSMTSLSKDFQELLGTESKQVQVSVPSEETEEYKLLLMESQDKCEELKEMLLEQVRINQRMEKNLESPLKPQNFTPGKYYPSNQRLFK